MLLLLRLVPHLGQVPFNASGRVFEALIPEIAHKGLLVPVLTMTAPPVIVADLSGAAWAWRVSRSMGLAAAALAVSLCTQLGFVAAACVFLEVAK